MFRAFPIISLVTLLSACNLYLVESGAPKPVASVASQSADTVDTEISPPAPPPPPKATPGSSQIGFMDKTTAHLEGCRFLSVMRLTHRGHFEDGLILLRNGAHSINANMMVPVRLVEMADPVSGLHYYHVRLMRCPKQNLSADS
ncbi:hypothetical protein [Candidatus Puniceispirillum sp.]|jgi:hypothetical protein|uniref:hypothetical protein n=1 Tax=Candidatus Puniceispirillum sp. TaxID=2026719 RepID=UPI001ED1FFF5|nr:hypothetical protein [Candidatus Puniceispirillum sp.]MBT6567217.1 hypothetical protein [Candidatus Puniceispirillum sp.]